MTNHGVEGNKRVTKLASVYIIIYIKVDRGYPGTCSIYLYLEPTKVSSYKSKSNSQVMCCDFGG